MNNHPFITQQIASARQQDLLASAAHRHFVSGVRAERSSERRPREHARRPVLGARPPQAHCACR